VEIVIVMDGTDGRAVEVVQLAATSAPDESADRGGGQDDGDWKDNVDH